MKSKQHDVASNDLRMARKDWTQVGGSIRNVRRTGEERWFHPQETPLTVNSRRKDTPAKAKTLINRRWRELVAANDSKF